MIDEKSITGQKVEQTDGQKDRQINVRCPKGHTRKRKH